MVAQGSRSHTRDEPSSPSRTLPGSPSSAISTGTRPLRRPQQGRQHWEEFADGRGKKQREVRKTVWSSYLDLTNLQPQDPTLLETILRELEEKELQASSPSSCRSRPGTAPATQRLQMQMSPSPSPATTLQRPQSAPTIASSPRVGRQRPASSSRPRRPAKLLRPQSAPRLLDGSGLLEKRPHHSPFLQKIEDLAVRETIVKFKRDGLGEKAACANIDIMHDSSLFDLKVLHNASARKRTAKIQRDASPPRVAESSKGRDGRDGRAAAVHRIGPRHPKWKDLSHIEQMRNLCHVMDMDLRLHGPGSRETAQAESTEVDMEAFSVSVPPPQESEQPVAERGKSFFDLSALNFNPEQNKKKMRTSHFVSNQNPEIVRITVNLLEFVLDKCTTLADFVRLLNNTRQSSQDNIRDGRTPLPGRLTRREWETALMALGYVSDDPSRFFRALDSENHGELMCDELVDALEAHCPNLIERRLNGHSSTRDARGSKRAGHGGKRHLQAHDLKPGADIPDASPIASESEASEA